MARYRVRWWLPGAPARDVFAAADDAACALGLVVDGAEIDDTVARFDVVCTEAAVDEGEELDELPEAVLAAVGRRLGC